MAVLGIDVGGTKICAALFSAEGELIEKKTEHLNGRSGADAGKVIANLASAQMSAGVESVGVCVPGISRQNSGTVWAPNIPGWDDYPLLAELQNACGSVPVAIDSDRACYILGEHWKGEARGCRDAIFMSVGTGIGAGIMIDGKILRGSHDIAGAIGWMALDGKYHEKYEPCGNYEYHASGLGLARVAREKLASGRYQSDMNSDNISAADVFSAYDRGDQLAVEIVNEAIDFWGRATANLISIFNPEKIIFGGGVFGPALKHLDDIKKSAARWAQPISMTQVSLVGSMLGGDAGVIGAGYLALQNLKP